MKVCTGLTTVIKIVPRRYPIVGDSLVMTVENRPPVVVLWSKINNAIAVTVDTPSNYAQGGYYSFTIKIGSEIIYIGKILYVKKGTDIQNYTANSQDTKRWK